MFHVKHFVVLFFEILYIVFSEYVKYDKISYTCACKQVQKKKRQVVSEM